jgi:serine phosphatase RsbU (regulator of sigma subunit)
MSASPLLDPVGTPDQPGDRTLVRLTEDVRALLPAGAVVVVTGERFAALFEDPARLLRTAGAHALPLPAVTEPLLFPRLDEWDAAPALVAGAVAPLGPQHARRVWHSYRARSVIACPLPAGLLVLIAADPAKRFDEHDLRVARVAAELTEMALDFQHERRLARALTLGFVPEPLPRLDDYETGLLYAPALGEPTGGDLYGIWQLPSGSVAVLVGDVAGKGVETAGLSAMARFFIEARSWDAESPARALDQTNAMLHGRLPNDTFVTAFLAVLTPSCLRWASAGHLPALHASGGVVHELGGTGLPLGVEASTRYEERELALADGDLLFAYTDGLVEARRGGEAYGPARFAALVARLAGSLDPERLSQAVHDEVAGWSGGLSDDAVALALRRRPAGERPSSGRRRRFARAAGRPAERSA